MFDECIRQCSVACMYAVISFVYRKPLIEKQKEEILQYENIVDKSTDDLLSIAIVSSCCSITDIAPSKPDRMDETGKSILLVYK
jgi:hypothetical protein